MAFQVSCKLEQRLLLLLLVLPADPVHLEALKLPTRRTSKRIGTMSGSMVITPVGRKSSRFQASSNGKIGRVMANLASRLSSIRCTLVMGSTESSLRRVWWLGRVLQSDGKPGF